MDVCALEVFMCVSCLLTGWSNMVLGNALALLSYC